MTLIIRQVTKAKNKYFKVVRNFGLISFLIGMVLTSCNTYIKPEETAKTSEPNDTLFLTEAYGYSKYGEKIADLARTNASNQNVRIFAEKLAAYHQKTEQKWDSLSKVKNISLKNNASKIRDNDFQNLSSSRSAKFDNEFIKQLENQIVSNIALLDDVSKRSEDNEITTMAITLLPELHEQLDSIVLLRQKLAVK